MHLKSPRGGGIWARWEVKVRDKSGIVVCHRKGPSHSFVRNFGLFIRAMFDNPPGAVNPDLTDSGGTTRRPRVIASGLSSSSTAVMDASAIMRFGNSAAAESSTQSDLQGLELESGATVTESLITEDTVETEFEIRGSVTNTGGSFTVEELGLFGQISDATSATTREIMFLRDLLQTGPATVLNSQTIEGIYTFTIPV